MTGALYILALYFFHILNCHEVSWFFLPIPDNVRCVCVSFHLSVLLACVFVCASALAANNRAKVYILQPLPHVLLPAGEWQNLKLYQWSEYVYTVWSRSVWVSNIYIKKCIKYNVDVCECLSNYVLCIFWNYRQNAVCQRCLYVLCLASSRYPCN